MIGIVMKAIFAIARMSKKTSAVFISILSFVFFLSTCSFIIGLIMIDPVSGNVSSSFAIPLVVTGAVFLCLSVFLVFLTTLASNYVRKNPHKDPKLNQSEKAKDNNSL